MNPKCSLITLLVFSVKLKSIPHFKDKTSGELCVETEFLSILSQSSVIKAAFAIYNKGGNWKIEFVPESTKEPGNRKANSQRLSPAVTMRTLKD